MGQPSTTGHVPVMAERTIALLTPALEQGGTYVDCTLGLGGHAEAVLRTCPRARLVGIDRDRDALAIARERLAREASGSVLAGYSGSPPSWPIGTMGPPSSAPVLRQRAMALPPW